MEVYSKFLLGVLCPMKEVTFVDIYNFAKVWFTNFAFMQKLQMPACAYHISVVTNSAQPVPHVYVPHAVCCRKFRMFTVLHL